MPDVKQLNDAIARDKRLTRFNNARLAKLRREIRWRLAAGKRQKARIAQRLHDLAIQTRTRSGADAAVSFALQAAKSGIHEIPAFSNGGPHISAWILASGGAVGQPWCQYFANRVMVAGGLPQMKDGYTPDFIAMARRGDYGLKLVSLDNRRPGDLLYYKWPGVSSATCDHVGVLVNVNQDVEGNTSPGRAGSQNNGGGVYLRDLDSQRRPFIVAVVRPPYPATR